MYAEQTVSSQVKTLMVDPNTPIRPRDVDMVLASHKDAVVRLEKLASGNRQFRSIQAIVNALVNMDVGSQTRAEVRQLLNQGMLARNSHGSHPTVDRYISSKNSGSSLTIRHELDGRAVLPEEVD